MYGNIYKKQSFVKGKPEGKWIEYYQNGKKRAQGFYKNELKNGKWIYWDKDGQIIYTITFSKGIKIKEEKPLEENIKNK